MSLLLFDEAEERQRQQRIEELTLRLQSNRVSFQRNWEEKIEQLKRDREDFDAIITDKINLLALRRQKGARKIQDCLGGIS